MGESHLDVVHSPTVCKNICALRDGRRDRPYECTEARIDGWHVECHSRLQPGLQDAGQPKRTVSAHSPTSAAAARAHCLHG